MDLELGVAVLVAALLCLDVRVCTQGMFSHPLVVAGILGAMLNSLEVAVQAGLCIGLVWSYALPVGGVIPPNTCVMAAIAVIVGINGGAQPQQMVLAVFWALPFAHVAARLDRHQRTWAIPLVAAAEGVDGSRRGEALFLVQALGALAVFLGGLLIIGLGVVSAMNLLPLVESFLSEGVKFGLNWTWQIGPLLGVGALLSALNQHRGWAWMGAGGLLALLVLGVWG